MSRRWDRTIQSNPEITEPILTDGLPDCVKPDLCRLFALNVLDTLCIYDGVVTGYDLKTVMQCLFIECIHMLGQSGDTSDKLKKEVDTHIDCPPEDFNV